MNKQQIVSINGVRYDAHTGMRLDNESTIKVSPKKVVTSHTVHAKTQRSKTLARKHVRAGQPKTLAQPAAHTIKQSPHIKRFADIGPATKSSQNIRDIAPIQHSAQTKANATKAARPSSTAAPTATDIKKNAIDNALSKSITKQSKKKSFFERHPRTFSIVSITFAILVVAGYLTYTNLPSLSVKVAAAQAGINAEYPSYQPSGYSISGPIAFTAGEVSIKFAANGGPQSFIVQQTKSNWDSSALLENYVKTKSDNDYTTYTDSGLTVYVYNTNAAWVNGGILHTINGDAPLTNDQIRKIATSM